MIVIPMAGESRRFQDAGYDVPKYMLPVSGRPLFDWVLLSFYTYFKTETFLFIARDMQGTTPFLRERTSRLGIKDVQIAILEKPTSGQAETVMAGLKKAQVPDSTEIIIFNIDTIRPRVDIAWVQESQGWLEIFSAPGNNWSFLEIDSKNPCRVIRCVEKKRISDHCCTGLYAFASAGTFLEALEKEQVSPSNCELFVAPLYNHLISAGYWISWREAPKGSVILSGVPQEYVALCKAGLTIEMFAN